MWRITRVIALTGGILTLLAVGPLPTAAADEPVRVVAGSSDADQTSILQRLRQGNFDEILIRSQSAPEQSGLAFSVFEGALVAPGAGRALSASEVPSAAHRASIAWIAENYQDVELPDSNASFSLASRHAAAQLAIWKLSSNSSNTLPEHGRDSVLDLRDAIVREGLAKGNGPLEPLKHVDLGDLEDSSIQRYFSGEKLQFSLTAQENEVSESPLKNETLLVSASDGAPYRNVVTNDQGLAEADIPWATAGPLVVQWSQSLPPGTFLRVGDRTLVLSQAIKFRQQKIIEHSASFPNRARYAWSGASRELNGYFGLAVAIVVGIGLLGGAILIPHAGAIAKAVGVGSIVLALVIVLVGCYLLAALDEHKHFHPMVLDAVPQKVDNRGTRIADARASTSFSKANQGRCAVDGNPRTAWQSDRGHGSGQFLDIKFTQDAWINVIQIVPGRLTSWSQYQSSGFPAAIDVLVKDGPFDHLELSRTETSGTERGDLERAGEPRMMRLKQPLHAKEIRVVVSATDLNKFSYVVDEIRPGWFSGADATYVKAVRQGGCRG